VYTTERTSSPRPYRRPATPPGTLCLACRRPVRSRPRRGLCRRCYAKPALRACYPYLGCLAGLNEDRPGWTAPGGARPKRGDL